jgi:hypothetical protein
MSHAFNFKRIVSKYKYKKNLNFYTFLCPGIIYLTFIQIEKKNLIFNYVLYELLVEQKPSIKIF